MSNPAPQYPQHLLDKVNATEHRPSERDATRYVFNVHHVDEDDHVSHAGTYGTLEKANKAALAYFKERYSDFFGQEEDMSNWYEIGTEREEQEKEVAWTISEHGELGLVAREDDSIPIVSRVFVKAEQVL
jgi:hypothetical protein